MKIGILGATSTPAIAPCRSGLKKMSKFIRSLPKIISLVSIIRRIAFRRWRMFSHRLRR